MKELIETERVYVSELESIIKVRRPCIVLPVVLQVNLLLQYTLLGHTVVSLC